jgi:UDP-N-acetylmuramate dehydrogenase
MQDKIQKNINLKSLTTFKIGGVAKFFVEVESKEELKAAIEWVKEKKEKVFIFGGGSNVLINSKGVDGLVIKLVNNKLELKDESIKVGAGVVLSKLVNFAASQNLSGIEWAIGIPGMIGGAVRGNIGAYGGSFSKIIKTVQAYNLNKNDWEFFSQAECEFSYRESIFKKRDELVIWEAELNLRAGKKEDIEILEKQYIEHRVKTQPHLPSAGSVFKNIPITTLGEVNSKLANEAIDLDIVKNNFVGAGWIIDKLGIKGKTIGGAIVSNEHGNFIVNTGEATSDDVIMLISYIKQQVRDRLGVQLELEIQLIGF